MKIADTPSPKDVTLKWIQQVVIGENLCPFARPILDRLTLTVLTGLARDSFLDAVVSHVLGLLDHSADERPTSILIMKDLGHDFEDYLDLADLANAVLDEIGVADEIQIATFHPQYQFADSDADDPANWTNRSPLPMLHFLRTADVASAGLDYPDVELIPERNIERFRLLGRATVQRLRETCFK